MDLDVQRLVNLTEHDIVILDLSNGSEIMKIPSSGNLRVEFLPDDPVKTILGIPFKQKRRYDTKGVVLPPRKPGTLYIVSQHVTQAFPDRDDFCRPDEKIRRQGKVIGCYVLRIND